MIKKIFSIPVFIFKVSYAVFALSILFAASYFFAYWFLRDPLIGNDAANSLTFITWIDRYWPNIPLWWPQQGSGSSFIFGYPALYNIVVVWLSRIINLSLVETMGIINFLIIPLTSFGIYFLVSTRFKNQTAAFISAFLFLLSPIGYIHIYGAGFLASSFSYIFVAPFLAFFDAYIGCFFLKPVNKKRTTWSLLGAAIFLALAMLGHPATGLGLIFTAFFYSIILVIFRGREALSYIGNVLAGFILFFITSISGVAFWLYSFWRYTNISNKGFGAEVADPATFPPIDLISTFGFVNPANPHYAFIDLSINKVITILAVFGVVFGLIISRKALVFGILAFWNLMLVGTFAVVIILVKISPFLSLFFSLRYALPLAIVMMPITAAFSAWAASQLFFKLIFFPLNKTKIKPLVLFLNFLTPILVAVFSVAFTIGAILYLNPSQPYYSNPDILYVGPKILGVNLTKPWFRPLGEVPKDKCSGADKMLLCDYPYFLEKLEIDTFSVGCDAHVSNVERHFLCTGSVPPKGDPIENHHIDEFLALCKEKKKDSLMIADLCLAEKKKFVDYKQFENWPKIFLGKGPSGTTTSEFGQKGGILEQALGKRPTRIAITPSLGAWIKEWSIYNPDIFVTNVYTGQIQLSKPIDGYFQSALFTKEPLLSKKVLNELAKWYGLDAAIVVAPNDPVEKFDEALWENKGSSGTQIRVPKEPKGLTSILSKSRTLVIGSLKKNAYEQVFRLATAGVLPYDEAVIFEGGEKIDDYSLEELKKYNVIVLHGYSYNSERKAWGLLEKYVKDGGNLFIDTGWEFVIPKVEIEDSPEFFPVSKTKWANSGQAYKIEGQDFEKGVDVNNFAPLSWNNEPWNYSGALRGDVRDWAEPILSVGESVLVAGGQYGKGKVVWSGMNLFPHVLDKKNLEEAEFLENIFKYLSLENKGQDLDIVVNRVTPDKLEFVLPENVSANTTLYFRESFYPDWQAKFVDSTGKSDRVEIHRTGPNFMSVFIPEEARGGDRIFLEFKKSLSEKLAFIVSIFTFTTLLLLFLDQLFKIDMFRVLTIKLAQIYRKPVMKLRKSLDDEQ